MNFDNSHVKDTKIARREKNVKRPLMFHCSVEEKRDCKFRSGVSIKGTGRTLLGSHDFRRKTWKERERGHK